MSWRKLAHFRDASIPKLHNLVRARRRGLSVPETVWCAAKAIGRAELDAPPLPPPLIVRSGSPTEDTDEGSQAGQFLSLPVRASAEFADAVRAVARSLPRDAAGKARGVVFVQPLLEAAAAGVAFFDGWYWERTEAAGGNADLTAGRARGEVARGHLEPGDPWSAWLTQVARALPHCARLDVEYARQVDGAWILLQARPALFEVRRNPTLSLANHKEILGDPPSPWIAAVVEQAGRDALAYYGIGDRRIREWREPYAVCVGERVWMNFGGLFRLMHHWGLPRRMVTAGVGGDGGAHAADGVCWSRLLRALPQLCLMQARNLRSVLRAERGLAQLDRTLAEAHDARALFDAGVSALALSLRTNFALGGLLSGALIARRLLRVEGRARVVTEEMMQAYEELRRAPQAERAARLGAWLDEYGHRGPLESDPARPRFTELRDVLLADLEAGGAATPASPSLPARGGPLFWLDRTRERFRDGLMRRWVVLRRRLLEEGARLVACGELDAVDDIFLLTGTDLEGTDLAERAARKRAALETARMLDLPSTASLDELSARLSAGSAAVAWDDAGPLVGIPLSRQDFAGRVRRADDLAHLLREVAAHAGGALDAETVLVVPALEPSWAVVFGRVGAVVAELGGELSHASILLREAGKPAVVNCRGAWARLPDGARVRLHGDTGCVELVE